jgi:hypothetical protein
MNQFIIWKSLFGPLTSSNEKAEVYVLPYNELLQFCNCFTQGVLTFFSDPRFSFRLLYCCLRVVINHLSTNTARFWGSFSLAGAVRMEGNETQYAEYSVREVELRIKGGAVREEMSPEKEDTFLCIVSTL